MTSNSIRERTPNLHRVCAVQPSRGPGRHWIFTPDGSIHERALLALRGLSPGTERTYAYSLADHLDFLVVNDIKEEDVPQPYTTEDSTLTVLLRYMAGLTGNSDFGVYGIDWRGNKKPVGPEAAITSGTAIRRYYLKLAAEGIIDDANFVRELEGRPVMTGPEGRVVMSNPLTPSRGTGTPTPRILPSETVQALFEPGVLLTARDRMIMTWLVDDGIRVGGLCGLRFCDLHLKRNHRCGQRREPHIHIIPRDDNPNGSRQKDRRKPTIAKDGTILGGVIRLVSDEMISTYYEYMLDERFPIEALIDHEQVLVRLDTQGLGKPLTTDGVRAMLARACKRAGIEERLTPHIFRHYAAAGYYAETDFNAQLVADEFGWASSKMVTERYGRGANEQAAVAMRKAWDRTAKDHAKHLKLEKD